MSEKQLHQWCYSTCVPLVREITFQNGEVGVGGGWGEGEEEVGVLTFSLIHAVCLGELAAYSEVSPLISVGCFGVEVGWWLQ